MTLKTKCYQISISWRYVNSQNQTKSFSDKFELILNPVGGNIITQLTLFSIVWLKKQIKTFWLQLWKRLQYDLNSKPVLIQEK